MHFFDPNEQRCNVYERRPLDCRLFPFDIKLAENKAEYIIGYYPDHESETKLTEINNSIAELLQERENVLKEWNTAFYTENQDEITCISEGIGITDEVYYLYLINGDSKMLACYIHWDYKECSINDFSSRLILPCTF